MFGPVWRTRRQSSPTAEFTAVAAAAQVLRSSATIVTDYQGCISAFAPRPLGPKRVNTGVVGAAVTLPHFGLLQQPLTKIKAHQSGGGITDKTALDDIAGNAIADREAKRAVGRHPTIGHKDDIEARIRLLGRTARFAGKALALWPSVRESLGRLARRPAKEKAAKPRGQEHRWLQHGGLWRCEVCLLRAHCRKKAELIRRSCPGACVTPSGWRRTRVATRSWRSTAIRFSC